MKIQTSAIAASLMGLLLFGQSAIATPTPSKTPSAASVVAEAEAKAASENKNVLLIFHASWCGWCHKLDDFLGKSDIAPLIGANYVTIHVVVQEADDKKDLDNPGGDALLESLGGKGQGIPYYAILSPTNETLAVSKNAKGQNIGYPGEKEEIPLFMKMLTTTSTHLTADDSALIEKDLGEESQKLADAQALYMKLNKPITDAMAKQDYKTAYAACEDLIASHPDQATSAYFTRFQALLHFNEAKALSEMGQAMGPENPQQADSIRASMIVQVDSLSDRAYNAALSIDLAKAEKTPATWYLESQIALAYSHLHNMKEAVEYQDKAIESAKAAKLPDRIVDGLAKTEASWQSKG